MITTTGNTNGRECTGLTDKKGRLIYVGDIVKAPFLGRKLHTFTVCKDPDTGKFLAVPMEPTPKMWPFDLAGEHQYSRVVGKEGRP